jgi:hypothetical protein
LTAAAGGFIPPRLEVVETQREKPLREGIITLT